MNWSTMFRIFVIVVGLSISFNGLVTTAVPPPCARTCYPKVYNTDNTGRPDISVICLYLRALHSEGCSMDLTEHVNVNTKNEVGLTLNFACSEAAHITFYIFKPTKRRNVLTTLSISGPCSVSLHQTISIVAQAVLLKSVLLYGGIQLLVSQELNATHDLNSIESFKIQNMQTQYNDVIALFTSNIWPRMVNFELSNIPIENTVANSLQDTMPSLQTLILNYDNLVLPPEFPWNNHLFRTSTRTKRYDKGVNLPRILYKRTLMLEYNNIEDLENYHFRGRLDDLSLKGNKLRVIGGSSFKHLSGLVRLNLGENKLSNLPRNLLAEQTSLIYLYLNYNNLSAIYSDAFQNLTTLTNLYLDNNNILRIQRDLLMSLVNLEVLHLEKNRIYFLDNNVLPAELTNLKEIYLQHNRMKYIPPWALVLPSLEVLDMSFNRITANSLRELFASSDEKAMLTIEFTHFETYRSFKLTNNYINSFSIMEIFSLRKRNYTFTTNNNAMVFLDFYTIDLTNNPIQCDCTILRTAYMLQYFIKQSINRRSKNQYRSWKCATPKNFAGLNILSSITKKLECRLNSSECASPCQCFQRSQDDAIIVDCRNKRLTHLPKVIPSPLPGKLLELHLEGNSINHLLPKTYLRNVTSLYLSHNNISVIKVDFLTKLSSIRELYIDNNNLERLPRTIQLIDFERLSLKHNLFHCTCSDLWMKKWLQNITDFVVDVNKIRCVSGPGKGKTLIAVPEDDFICRDSKNNNHSTYVQDNTHKIIAYTLGAIFGILSLASVIIYRLRGEIKVLAYAHFHLHPFDRFDNNEDNNEVIYDAFVSYSHHDSRWVIEVLRERLETNDPPFKLCIHDRDFLVGSTIQENILTSVRQSKRMLLILSRDFIRSEWCLFAFRAAHDRVLQDRNNYLIIILLEDIGIEEVDDEMKLYMRTNTYLSVQNRWFWQKLLYALPRNPIRVEPAPHLEVQEQHHQNLGQHEGDVVLAEIQE